MKGIIITDNKGHDLIIRQDHLKCVGVEQREELYSIFLDFYSENQIFRKYMIWTDKADYELIYDQIQMHICGNNLLWDMTEKKIQELIKE